jgi:hypothetical protein
MNDDPSYRGWDFWIQRRQVGMHLIHAWPDKALKVVAATQVPANQWMHVAVTYDGSRKAAGVKVYYDGQTQKTNAESNQLDASTIRSTAAFTVGQRNTGSPFSGSLQDLRVFRRVLTPAEIDALARTTRMAAVLAKPADQRTEEEREGLFGFWLGAFDAPYRARAAALADLEQEQQTTQARGTIAHVMHERVESATAFVLYRGEYDQRREPVAADTPDVLPPFPADAPRNRLGFAQWLLEPDHPLTARVTVNRFWQEVFGTGIVGTAGDFGVTGELPTHPELLDWLATEFRESGWDVKRFFKLLVTSATYRQAATLSAQKLDLDPGNRLLSRGPRFRMDAEMVRDHALAASGLLVRKIGGPSVKPYQPEGVWEAIAMNVSNTRSYEPGSGEDLYRRSLYTFIKRMAPPASMDIFNAPNREYCVVRRERTNTALQALVTLNDEHFVEAARQLAQHAIQQGGGSTLRRLQAIGRRLLARDFQPDEIALMESTLQQLRRHYASNADDARQLIAVGQSPADAQLDPTELAAWTMLTNALMNLDEALNK